VSFVTTIADILVGILGLFIMILVHEFGHLVAGKLLKVKVETFSLGYGRKLWGFTWRGTTYQIAVFPLGGFTKFSGEHLFAKAIEENLDRIPADGDSYYNQPPWKRVLISFAGPLANVIFAVVFFTIIYWAGFNQYDYGNRIILASEMNKVITGASTEANPADAAGLQSGDRITAVNGTPVVRFGELAGALASAPDKKLVLTVVRNDKTIEHIEITPRLNKDYGAGFIGIYPDTGLVVSHMNATTAAMNSWLKPGDLIVEAGGRPVTSRLDLVLLCLHKPLSLPMTVRRDGRSVRGTFYPDYSDKTAPLGLAFQTKAFRTPPYTPWQALAKGFENIGQTVYSIGLFFTLIPRINVGNSVSGPIRTTFFIGQAAIEGFQHSFDQGLVQFVIILCYLSVILAIMNLLPLGIMDGGFIVLFLIEAIRRKPYRPRFLYIFQLVGFVLLVGLGLFVILNDIIHLAT
jgi:regulator of sigma E protease